MITGFPSPAQGYEDAVIDLNELLVRHPAATVFMRIESSRYTRVGIYPGDLLVVDRSLNPENAAIVVRECDGHFVLGSAASVAEGAVVCGVVTHVIHTVRRESGGSFQERGGEEGSDFQGRAVAGEEGRSRFQGRAGAGEEGQSHFQGRGPL